MGLADAAPSAGSIEARATALIARSFVWDNHACMPLRPGDTGFLHRLAEHRAAGFDAITLNVAMDMLPWEHGIKMLATFRAWVKAHPDDYLLGDSVAALERARAERRLAVLFDIEGGGAVDNLPELVDVYHALGVRWMLIAYNRRNRLGAGCQVEDEGLTAFGRRVIDAMERAGIVLCCSHTGERTAAEAIDHARNPVIFSHSNAAAVHPHRRNVGDALIRACAAKGGVIGLTGFGPFVAPPDRIDVEALIAHAEHIAALVGPSHIGLGLDYVFDPSEGDELLTRYPEWFPGLSLDEPFPLMLGASVVGPLTAGLLRRGWSEEEVAGVLGGNLLRIARQVWK